MASPLKLWTSFLILVTQKELEGVKLVVPWKDQDWVELVQGTDTFWSW